MAVAPPVLMTTGLLWISAAYGVPPGNGSGLPHGHRTASSTVRSASGPGSPDVTARQADVARSTHLTRGSVAPSRVLAHTAGQTASAATLRHAPERGHPAPVGTASASGHQDSGPSRLWPAMPPLPLGAFPLTNGTSALLGLVPAPVRKAPPGAAGAPASGHSAARLSATEPSSGASRAGSEAGEGRARPGRADAAPQDEPTGPTDPDSTAPDVLPSADATAEAVGPAASSPAPSQKPAVLAREAATSQPVVEILPLGSGLVLVGAGLALALLALRLRRE
ncbi:hypothetical protein PV336_06700 [Streptomyces sp. MI02-2A]|uniref:hypothetical protein n=1 Tax=unclassified Streptomyces TaxID=2593676 RepID=UPI0029A8E976|nr:hypothetical protein [Streptomyces sp. MI02-2A]MDX3258921.1 hypothetical protein [Streptomyces sp. MI02-2A]